MGMMKNYLLNLLHQCSVEKFGQDAIEWGIVSGMVQLTYNSDRDIHQIMSRYDEIIGAYRLSAAQAARELTNERAPMERAVPRRRAKAGEANARIQRKHTA
jgi:hypothetical protein